MAKTFDQMNASMGMTPEVEKEAPCHATVEAIEGLQKEALQYLDQLLGSQRPEDTCRAIDRGRVGMLALQLNDIRITMDEIVRQLNMLSQRIG